jgi:metal transporter CNNM
MAGVLDWLGVFVLICFSALFSGLTLGLMGLDKMGLEVVIKCGEMPNASANAKREAAYARKIQPLRADGNLLLCTLLLGNVFVNAELSILLAGITSGTMGLIVSTVLIVIFGEIMPQATCARYALRIGATFVPIVVVIKYLLLVATYPIARLLDKLLGDDVGTVYQTDALLQLMLLHKKHKIVDADQTDIMEGALNYKDKEVRDVMTPIDRVKTLSVDDVLNFKEISGIFRSGYSRIPVTGAGGAHDIVGMLFTKDLIFIDPQHDIPVRNYLHIFGRQPIKFYPDEKLGDCLVKFKKGRSHMAVVHEVNNDDDDVDPWYEVQGIITLEDIIEEILGDEIVDETDQYVEVEKGSRVERESFDYARLRLLDTKNHATALSDEEARAIAAHLQASQPEIFAPTVPPTAARAGAGAAAALPLSKDAVEALVCRSKVVEIPFKKPPPGQAPATPRAGAASAGAGAAAVQSAASAANRFLERGRIDPMPFCTVIITGKMVILAGREGWRSEAGPFAVLAPEALTHEEGTYAPDFSAEVLEDVRCVRISRRDYTVALEAFARGEAVPAPLDGAAAGREEFAGLRRTSMVMKLPPVKEAAAAAAADARDGDESKKGDEVAVPVAPATDVAAEPVAIAGLETALEDD